MLKLETLLIVECLDYATGGGLRKWSKCLLGLAGIVALQGDPPLGLKKTGLLEIGPLKNLYIFPIW